MERFSVLESLKQYFQWLAKSWDKFFFQPVDTLPLSLLRILVGGMLLYTHLVWGTVLTDFLGPSAWNTGELVASLRPQGFTPSLWWYVSEDWMSTVHIVCNLVIAMFILGLGGRVVAILTWAIAISYAHRTGPANYGLDQINCMLALYLTIGPTTQYLSLDRWLRKRFFGRSTADLDRPSASANVALRLIQIHMCIIYLWAGLGKLQGDAWWNGNAMWLALANYEYQSFDMTWMVRYPRLMELLTHVTIAWEIGFSFLVWPKATRPLVLAIGAGMHLGICMFLGMWTFGSIMIFAYVSFFSGGWLRSVWKALRSMQIDKSQQQAQSEQVSESPSISSGLQSLGQFQQLDVTQQVLPGEEHQSQISAKLPQLEFSLEASIKKTVVLITESEKCIENFMQMNRSSELNWLVVASLREAEKLVPLLPGATYLFLELRSIEAKTALEYVVARVVRVKRASPVSHSNESSHQAVAPVESASKSSPESRNKVDSGHSSVGQDFSDDETDQSVEAQLDLQRAYPK